MDNLLNVLLSAGTAALISGIFAVVNKIMDFSNAKKTKKDAEATKNKEDYLLKKEQAYIDAIRWLIFIKKGFSITQEDLRKDSKLKEECNEEIKKYMDVSPLIRLYATDQIYLIYSNLCKYKKYAFTYSENCWRLFEESKENFNTAIDILAKLMKADLGYRELDNEVATVKCPKCKKEHDMFVTCKCGMTFIELQTELLKEIQENQKKMEQTEDNA